MYATIEFNHMVFVAIRLRCFVSYNIIFIARECALTFSACFLRVVH